MYKKYNAIVRKSRLECMAICFELNIAARARCRRMPKVPSMSSTEKSLLLTERKSRVTFNGR
jgi:hypothetical protein